MLISLLILKDSLAGYRICGGQFSPVLEENHITSLRPLWLWGETLGHLNWCPHRWWMHCFSRPSNFFFSQKFDLWCVLAWISLYVSYLEFILLLGNLSRFCLAPNPDSFPSYSPKTLSAPLSFSSFWERDDRDAGCCYCPVSARDFV